MRTKSSKTATKKKSYKGSDSSSSTNMILRDTTQLFSIHPIGYDKSMSIMIEFISRHPIVVLINKIPNPNFPLRLLHKAFERVKIKEGVLEVKKTDYKIIPVHNANFLKATRIP